jgi:hypothetical protein
MEPPYRSGGREFVLDLREAAVRMKSLDVLSIAKTQLGLMVVSV